MRLSLIFLGMILLAACTPAAAPDTTENASSPTGETIQGQVNITSPLTGSSIFAEAIYIAGTAQGIPDDRFHLRVVTIDEVILAETDIIIENNAWSVELIHEYDGVPNEALIIAEDGNGNQYDAESVLIASMENRPQGTFGIIISPQEDAVVGGDQIEVMGTGSGLFENTLFLQLANPDGEIITEIVITLDNPYFVDERVWVADVNTEGHTGPAELRIGYQDAESGDFITLDEQAIMLSVAAG
ncbi:MAG: hypothetical protein KC496_08710 [Anaerolineae bacterium]|nr:hypothetical protein [Anaerolineae bacterium]